MKSYTDIFIDFDDTLYDTRGNATLALQEIFDLYHLQDYFPESDTFYEAFWKSNMLLWGQYAHDEITRDHLILERFRQPLSIGMGSKATVDYCLQMSDDYLERCSCKPGVIEGSRQLLDYLVSRHYRIHMCSNGFEEVQHKKLAACGMAHYFDTIILSEHAGANKPSSQFFHYAMQQTGATPSTTIMIGDNYNTDIEGAMSVGIDTILFNRWDIIPPRPVTHQVDTLADIINIL